MKAYVFSIGERTTNVCVRLMEQFKFDVVLLDGKESSYDKYCKFIWLAAQSGEDVLKIDADIIPNPYIRQIYQDVNGVDKLDSLMVQYSHYCVYRNGINVGNPVFYRKEAIKIIAANLGLLDKDRPEATAWRLKEINPWTQTSDLIVGLHAAFQDKEHLERAYTNKVARKQIDSYDFTIAQELI